ncbi:MAG TPA: glucose 1-dehydrogenase [Stellaceae bacterium]|nr:glucose 1-dehydrogenase [Stellaceae bacterium]
MTDRLSKEMAVVSGAGSGIGRATALRLAREGAKVLAVDIAEPGLVETAAHASAQGRSLATLVKSVADADAPETILNCAAERLGGISLLVNNAGIGGSHRAEDTTDEEFDRFLSVNLRSVFRMSRAAVGRMRGRGGAIVNIASIFGMTGFPGTTSYAAAKAGVIGITMQMAADYGPEGIRVNAISPGLIETGMTRERIASNAWFRSLMLDMTPLGRAGKPEDIAAAVAFLGSADAAFITGQVLTVDGGWLATRYKAAPSS